MAAAGNLGVIKVFGALNGGVNELAWTPSAGSTVVKATSFANFGGFNNGGDVGGGYPIAAVDAQYNDGSVRLAWTTNVGGIDEGILNADDSVFEFKQNLAPANSVAPGTTVSMVVPAPGKAMLFWSQNGSIWELSYDCFLQNSCAKGAGTWSGPTNVDLVAGVTPAATVSAVSPTPGNLSLFWTKGGAIWTKSFNYLAGWTADTDLYDFIGSPVQFGDAAPGTDIVAVSTTPGGVSLFWPSLSGGGIFTGVLPPGVGTTQFGPAQLAATYGPTSNATVIAAIPNTTGVDKEVSLFWQGVSGSALGDVLTTQYGGAAGFQWSPVIGLTGVQMVP